MTSWLGTGKLLTFFTVYFATVQPMEEHGATVRTVCSPCPVKPVSYLRGVLISPTS